MDKLELECLKLFENWSEHWISPEIGCPGVHGDHGTSVSDEIDQKIKVGQNTCFFLRIFPPAHFDHRKLR